MKMDDEMCSKGIKRFNGKASFKLVPQVIPVLTICCKKKNQTCTYMYTMTIAHQISYQFCSKLMFVLLLLAFIGLIRK